MADGTLVIGTRRYSSWSMRGWLAVRLAGLDVVEEVIPLEGNGATAAVRARSPSGTVPYLEHRGHRVWESLAILEYCAEFSAAIWPADLAARTQARVIATEMHGGFRDLREAMPMNLGRELPGRTVPPGARADLIRIEQLWSETRLGFGEGGPYLFGAAFSGADAMYAPVVARLITYRPEIAPATRAYCAAVRAHPLVAAWYDAAAAEPAEWLLDKYEHPA
jgi:glutathione S-transferase